MYNKAKYILEYTLQIKYRPKLLIMSQNVTIYTQLSYQSQLSLCEVLADLLLYLNQLVHNYFDPKNIPTKENNLSQIKLFNIMFEY